MRHTSWYVLVCFVSLFLIMLVPIVSAENYSFVTAWGSNGSANGQFYWPVGITVDSAKNVFVTDFANDRIQKFTSNGTFLTTWGSAGSGDGYFLNIYGVAVDSADNVYIADHHNNRIQVFSPDGTFLKKWGSFGSDDGNFSSPSGVAIDSQNFVYVADKNNFRIQKFTSNGTFLTKWGTSGIGDGQFRFPYGVAVDSSGNVYVTDTENSRIEKFTSNGTFLMKWGSNGTSTGQFYYPFGIAVDSADNVYVSDTRNHRVQKFNSTGTFITQWGSYGSGNGQFKYVYGLALDSAGDVYVADQNNYRVQKFSLTSANPPVANFTATPRSGTAPLIVRFTDMSIDAPTSWSWNFGDSSLENATVQNPVHTYRSEGNYSVSLNVSNTAGFDTLMRTEYIRVTNTSMSNIGVFRNNHDWLLDSNGNGVWDGTSVDKQFALGKAGDIPVTGDWNGDGKTEIGVFRDNHTWNVDYNGNGVWDGMTGGDRIYITGKPGDVPVPGDWNGNNITEMAVFRGNHTWYIDYNGNGIWDSPTGGDRIYITGKPGDVPVPGDWNGDGITEMAVFRDNHTWYIDYNGNGIWDSPTGGDRIYTTGQPGDLPVYGDWNGDRLFEMGVFRSSNHNFYLDFNANGIWDGASVDKRYDFGTYGDIPVSGKWV